MTQAALAVPWAFQQLVKLHNRRPELVDTAIARLVQDDQELRWSLVVNAYLDEQINLGKAAELLNMPELALRERFIELGIPLRIGSADLTEAQAEVNAVRAWFEEL